MHAQGPSGMGSIFYKTKLCSRFRSGNCPYNTNCNFAHGMEELCKPPPGWEDFVTTSQQQQELPSSSSAAATTTAGGSTEAAAAAAQVRFHKTRPCKKYFGEGNCPYGDKCNFLHDEQSVPRAVREAREAAVAANHTHNATPNMSDHVVANSPPRANGPGGGGSTASASGSGPQSARPPSWKTKLCNKWETTGHCPFGDKCHFAHGSDELQRVGDANASAISETTSRDSWQQQRGAREGNSNWRGPNEISTIYGDWWVEDENWHAIHESIELEGDVIWGEA